MVYIYCGYERGYGGSQLNVEQLYLRLIIRIDICRCYTLFLYFYMFIYLIIIVQRVEGQNNVYRLVQSREVRLRDRGRYLEVLLGIILYLISIVGWDELYQDIFRQYSFKCFFLFTELKGIGIRKVGVWGSISDDVEEFFDAEVGIDAVEEFLYVVALAAQRVVSFRGCRFGGVVLQEYFVQLVNYFFDLLSGEYRCRMVGVEFQFDLEERLGEVYSYLFCWLGLGDFLRLFVLEVRSIC